MNNVIINRGQGGLGRQPLGQDFISGMILYGSSGQLGALSPVWATGTVKKFGSISDAIVAGIVNTHNDETPAILETAVTLGTTGDSVNFYFLEPGGNNILLGAYTQTSGDTTATLFATHAAAAITANQYINGGYTATGSTTNILITLRPGLGVYANTNYASLLTFTYPVHTGSLGMGVPTLSASGVASICDSWYYHINRFFVQSPNSTLYVGIWDSPGSWTAYTFPEVGAIQGFANGAIRQCGIYIPAAFDNTTSHTQVTAIEAQVKTLITNNSPVSVILGADFSGIGGAANLTTLAGLNSEHVSVSAGQDGGANGALLFSVSGKSITQVGDVLGLVAASQVSDDIAWVATYTLSPDGIENAIPAFATGELLSALSAGTIDAVDASRYIFGRQFINDSPNGTYINDSHCCTAYTSDYAYIENNRTFDKASRQLYAAYVEQLAAPLTLNADGTLTNSTVAFFEGIGEQALSNMAQTNPNTGRPELSGFSVTINPAQNVLSTSALVVTVLLQPVGVAREIIINLQFAVSL